MHDRNAPAAARSPLTLTVDRLQYASGAEPIRHDMRAGGLDAAHTIGAHPETFRQTVARIVASLRRCERFRGKSSTAVAERTAAP